MNNELLEPKSLLRDDQTMPAIDKELEQELFSFAEYSHEGAERVAFSNYSYWKSTVMTFSKNKIAIVAICLLLFIVVFAFIQPYLPNQYDPEKSVYLYDISKRNNKPSAQHWFGTEKIGIDLWARVWAGTRVSLQLAIIVGIANTIIGTVIGAIWGYIKKIDRIMTELYNFFYNIPELVLLVLLSYIMGPSFWTMVFVLIMLNWIGTAKYIRNLVLIIRDREYNMASKCLGTPVRRMISKNLLPQLISVIILRLALMIPAVISLEIILTFLGVGLPLEKASLGALISAGQSNFSYLPHLLVFPVVISVLITTTFYIVGNAFSDASDPRNHT